MSTSRGEVLVADFIIEDWAGFGKDWRGHTPEEPVRMDVVWLVSYDCTPAVRFIPNQRRGGSATRPPAGTNVIARPGDWMTKPDSTPTM